VKAVGGALEILTCRPQRASAWPPLLFIHGAYTAAWCWEQYFLPYFAQQGFDVHALSLRGHGGSHASQPLDLCSLDDYAADALSAAAGLARPPVLIGHSMGAVIAQRIAQRCAAPAMVLLAPVPPRGLAESVFSLALRDPPLFLALTMLQAGGALPSRELKRVRDYLFSHSVTEAEALTYLFRMQRESQRALTDLAWPQHAWIRGSVGRPVLVLGASDDAFFSASMTAEAAALHGVGAHLFAHTAHFMMLEPAWRDVAEHIGLWLEAMLQGG
jgi:pimeloyl-ACP methyl ester carboxylesterase